MSSNIYYESKQLISENLPPQKKSFFSFFKRNEPPKTNISVEDVKKILGLDIIAMSFPPTSDIPFKNIWWRSEALDYNHEELGKVYIPKNISFTDGKEDYYIVLIDGKLEMIHWVGSRVKTGGYKEKMEKRLVNQEEMKAIEKSFYALIEESGVNKSLEERFGKLRGVTIKKSDLTELIQALVPKEVDTKKLIDQTFVAAKKPLDFFIEHQEALKQIDIDEPSKELYQLYLFWRLQELDLAISRDWKLEAEEINHVVSKLSGGSIKEIIKKEEVKKAEPTEELLKNVNANLKEHHLVLMNIDLGGDDYNLILVPLKNLTSTLELAEKCKIRLQRAEEA